MDLQLFLRDTEQADTWMTKQEAFLVNDDLGDSLDSVEALLKKHGDFEKSLAAQEEKIKVGALFLLRKSYFSSLMKISPKFIQKAIFKNLHVTISNMTLNLRIASASILETLVGEFCYTFPEQK